MPVKNGIQTVQAIKRIYQSINDDEGRNLVEPNYIFLSAHIANLSFQTHCRNIGVEYFFEKPVSPDKLNLML
jgi:CheY-like chemotaxis protein